MVGCRLFFQFFVIDNNKRTHISGFLTSKRVIRVTV